MTDDVWEAVIADMQARRRVGLGRYGKPVRAADPEDWLQHLTEEIYDAAVYLKAMRGNLSWVATQIRQARAVLAGLPSGESPAVAEAVSLLDSVLTRSGVLAAPTSSPLGPG